MFGLYLTSALILSRNLVRIVEYIQGYGEYSDGHEAFLYIFDAVPMFLVMVVMVVIYAPSHLQQEKKIELAQSTVEMEARGSRAEID